MKLVLRYFILLIILFISLSAQASQLSGKIKIITLYDKKANVYQCFDFCKKGNKIRIDTNEDTYSIIDTESEIAWIISPDIKTVSKVKIQNMTNFSQFPLLVFQTPEKLKEYLKKNVINKSSVKVEVTEKYEIISFILSDTHFKITYSKDMNIPLSVKIISSISSFNINIAENKIKIVPEKEQLFVIPKNYKILDYSNNKNLVQNSNEV